MSDHYQPSSDVKTKGDRPSRVRYWVLVALCLAAFVAYVQRNSIGVAEEHIRNDLNLSKKQMGWVISAFFLTYAIFQLPAGYLGKVWGTRNGLAFFAITFSLAAGLFAMGGVVAVAFAFWWVIGARLLMGVTQAGIFPCAVNTILKWMPDKQRATAAGFLGSSMSIGAWFGVTITGLLLTGFVVAGIRVTPMSWEWVFGIYCLPGFLFAVLFYLWFRDEPHQHIKVNEAEVELIRGLRDKAEKGQTDDEMTEHEPTPWREILTSRSILALCGQQVFRAMGYMFFGSWFATFLRETREVDTAVAGVLTGLPILAVIIGSSTGGIVSDWILAKTGNRRLSRQGVAAVALLACAILVLLSSPVANPWLAVALISAGAFCAAFGGPCAYTSTIDMGGRHVPMVFSTMNMAGNIGAFVFPIVVPWMLSESELYVDKISIRAAQVEPINIEVESAAKIKKERLRKKFREEDATVLRFHHGTNEKRTLSSEHEITLPKSGEFDLVVRYAGENPPPLRLLVDGVVVSEDIIGKKEREQGADELMWSKPMKVTFGSVAPLVRIETVTKASGNWNLVLFVFAGIYVAASVCWLLVDTNFVVQGASKPREGEKLDQE